MEMGDISGGCAVGGRGGGGGGGGFFNGAATTEISTLSLHDALPLWRHRWRVEQGEHGVRSFSAADQVQTAPVAVGPRQVADFAVGLHRTFHRWSQRCGVELSGGGKNRITNRFGGESAEGEPRKQPIVRICI